MNIKKIRLLPKILVFLLSILVLTSLSYALQVDPPETPRDFTSEGMYFHNSGGNVYFATNTILNFNQIVVNENYVMFNDTGFYVASSNRVNISLVFIDNDISNAVDGNKVLEFWADTSSGNVFFNISGFKSSHSYYIFRDGSYYMTVTSNSSACISFNEDSWSEHHYKMFDGEYSEDIIDSLGIPVYLVVMGAVILVLMLIVYMMSNADIDPVFFIWILLAFVLVIVLLATLFSL